MQIKYEMKPLSEEEADLLSEKLDAYLEGHDCYEIEKRI